MLEYILNTTAIWLIGLLMFDLFLRRETFHNYNRVYLLAVLISGVLIPFWSWDSNDVVYSSGITQPLLNSTATLKEGITSTGSKTIIPWSSVLWIVYLSGVGITTGRVIYEAIQIIGLLRDGTKKTITGKKIVSINKAISPFSLFGHIFIYNADSYEVHELKMILAHEEKHVRLLHTIDLIVMRTVQIVFWFHPLVYLIENRLRMVHEYQADNSSRVDAKTYGKFLVEQSVLGAAPTLSHSFIRSPLKKRIMMLTRKTSRIAKSKQFFILPFAFITMVCCTQTAFSDDGPQKDGNKVTYRGNVIEFSEQPPNDTTWVEDPVSGELSMAIVHSQPMPLKLNDEKIYNDGELSFQNNNGVYTDNSSLNAEDIKRHLLKGLEKELKALGDGKYSFAITNIVVDKKGNVVYFEYDPISTIYKGMFTRGPGKSVTKVPVPKIDEDVAKAIEQKISHLMNNLPKQTPAQYKGKNVHSIGVWYHEKFAIIDGRIET